MDFRPVQSSNIKRAGYDPESRIMAVEFNSGIYHYPDVPPDKWEQFAATFDDPEQSSTKHLNLHFRTHHPAARQVAVRGKVVPASKKAVKRTPGQNHPPDVKAQVMALLLTGASVSEIATSLNVPHQTVSRWKATLTPDELSEIGLKKGARVDDLVYSYLLSTFETCQKLMLAVSNESYIQKQPAAELATLFGVISDKGFRILDAAERARQLRAEQSGDPPQIEA